MNIYKLFSSTNKSKLILSKFKSNYNIINNRRFYEQKQILIKLDNPYGLNFRNYFIIKYIISIIISIVIFIRTSNIFISLIYFIIIFFIPNILIKKYQKNESNKLIKELTNLNNNLVLLLTSNISFYDALKIAKNSIDYKRFREKYEIFVEDYNLFNFNIKPALEKFQNNFTSDELDMFVNIVYQADREGKMIEMLEVFHNTLELSYFKYSKYKQRQISTYILISAIICLLNITIITIYPMIVQIVENIGIIFK